MNDEVLAVVRASQPRRWLGVGMLAMIGGIVLYVAFATPPALEWQLFLLVTGAVMLWTAERLRRATEGWLELTETELRDNSGRTIVRIDEITGLDRGAFAFKPSNGFLIRTKTPGPRGWQTGMWWRVGRRIGVGGVTAARETKFMSEIISALIQQR